MFSYTLRVQSEGYARTAATRIFLCASSPDESGSEALEWVVECLVQDGDELVVFRGIDQEELGMPAFPSVDRLSQLRHFSLLHSDKDHELVREEARELMRQIQGKCVEHDPKRKVFTFFLTFGNPAYSPAAPINHRCP